VRAGRLWPLLLVLASSVASAQQGEARQAAPQRPPGEPEDRRSAREEAFRMVDAYVVSHLQESLGLTDEQYAKAVPLVTRLQRERREYFVGRARAMRELRRLLREGGAVEAQVVERLEELKKLEAEGPERVRRQLEAVDAALTPLQQAKYRVLEGEVEKRVRELASRVRTRPGERQRGQPEPPE
jgi:hypothetical protein